MAAKDNGGFTTFPYSGACYSAWPATGLNLIGPTVSADDKTLTFSISSTTTSPLTPVNPVCNQNAYKILINLREWYSLVSRT